MPPLCRCGCPFPNFRDFTLRSAHAFRDVEFQWTAPDGNVYPCEEWLARGTARGLLVGLHGLGGSASDFGALAEALSHEGLSCFALNLRGQGHDPVRLRRGAELDLEMVAQDASAFAQEMSRRCPGGPLWVCGESMGAMIAAWMDAGGRWGRSVAGNIFSAPVIELKKNPSEVVKHVLRSLSHLVPFVRFYPSFFVSGSIKPLRTTRDEEHLRRVRSSRHYLRAFTLTFLRDLDGLMGACLELAPRIRTPCLVLAGGCDIYLRPEQVKAWFDRLGASDKTFRVYPESIHLLWNDWDRPVVIADVIGWLRERGAFNT